LPFLPFWQILLFAKITHFAPFAFAFRASKKIAPFWLFAYFAFIPSPAN